MPDGQQASWGNAASQTDFGRSVAFDWGIKLGTPDGWQMVEWLRAGDKVLTLGGGAQAIDAVHEIWAEDAGDHRWVIPKRTLGNSAPLIVALDGWIAFRSVVAEQMYDTSFVTMPAAALDGFRGVTEVRAPTTGTALKVLEFSEPQVVVEQSGTMLVCGEPEDIPRWAAGRRAGVLTALEMREARKFLDLLSALDSEIEPLVREGQ